MSITVRHPVRASIEDGASFMEHLIQEYPRLLDDWAESTNTKFQDEAKRIANGDYEVYRSIMSQQWRALEDNDFRKDIFYKSMLIATYSYYERMLCKLAEVSEKPKQIIKSILEKTGKELSKEAKKNVRYIDKNTRIIRNELVHNNTGKPRNENKIKTIINKWPEITFDDNIISITDDKFIIDSLQKELFVLNELCNILNYKHKLIK